MAKNVLIFCDGTGQVGGVHFDEPRTNIYKMYRAMRCGPDSCIDPSTQVAFYDPGIGSSVDGGKLVGSPARAIYNLIAQATGFGITRNIVDCYAAVIRLWEPGDRIWLFGFSRGAYTARCVAEVLALCGVPTTAEDGQPIKLDHASVRQIAAYAVKQVYQFTSPCPPSTAKGKKAKLEDARMRMAQEFRDRHGARRSVGDGTYPYFVGVFDSVAALINPPVAAGLATAALLAAGALSFVLSLLFSPYGHRLLTFFLAFALVVAATAVGSAIVYVASHLKIDWKAGWKDRVATVHMTDAYPKFYDEDLDPNIAFANHAISIDENRASFARVHWSPGHRPPVHDSGNRPWFEQVWFAGNHADIGGGYSENESRLSDIALSWMVDCACEVPGNLRIDPDVIRRWSSPAGPQHDEVKAGFGWLTRLTSLSWPAAFRGRPKAGVILHDSVYDRFEAGHVPHFDGYQSYRPETLRGYPDVAALYDENSPKGTKPLRNSTARRPKAISGARNGEAIAPGKVSS